MRSISQPALSIVGSVRESDTRVMANAHFTRSKSLTPTPMDPKSRDALALRFAQIASEAGAIVMASPRTATRKPDGSPVTAADRDAEKLTRARLREFDATLPIIAEESFAGAAVKAARRFVLVDPLDGTRDFVAGRSEFT